MSCAEYVTTDARIPCPVNPGEFRLTHYRSHDWVRKGGWNIADCVERAYDLEGMHVGTVAAGRIGGMPVATRR